MYQDGPVERVLATIFSMATSLWANKGANPSGNSTAGRPWYFRLVWQNDCSVQPWPCGFALYPDNPNYLPKLAVDATSQAATIKAAARAAFKKAFDGYPVIDADEGRPDTGDHRVNVIDGNDLANPCGRTDNAPGVTVSEVFYLAAMERAQWALPVVLQTAQDAQSSLSRVDLMKAIGAGIGNNAAHELVHQFFQKHNGMDDSSTNTYNGKDCNGDTARWVYGIGPIGWEDVTANALKTTLNALHK